VALHEVVLDDAGKPVNYRILDVNPRYQSFTGLSPSQVIGKLATEARALGAVITAAEGHDAVSPCPSSTARPAFASSAS